MTFLDRNDPAILYLEIQSLTASVVVPFLHSLIPSSVSPVAEFLITASSYALGCPDIHDLFRCSTHSSILKKSVLYPSSFFQSESLFPP